MKRFLTAVLLTTCLATAVALAGGPTAKFPSSSLNKADIVSSPLALPLDDGTAAHRQPPARTLDDLVYSEDFEGIVSGDLPSGWLRFDQDGGFCNQWNRNSLFEVFNYGQQNARSGTRVALVHYNDGALPNNDWLVMPQITAGAGLHMHYYVASQDPDFLESYEVLVSTTGPNPADFTTVVETVVDAPVLWTRHTVDLGAFANQSIYVAFHCTSTDRFVLKFDDIEVNADDAGPSGSFAGVVRWAVDSTRFRPITDSEVTVTVDGLGYQTVCLDDGSYRFNFVPAGVHSISVVSGLIYTPGSRSNIQVTAGDITDSVNVVLNKLDTTRFVYRSTGLPRNITDFDTTYWPIRGDSSGRTAWDVNVTLNIEHSWVGDLDIWLRSPDGRSVQLYQHNLNIAGDDFVDVTLDDEAGGYIFFATPPYVGTLRPATSLSAMDGVPMSETQDWTLVVYDNFGEDDGNIVGWSIQVIAIPEGLVNDVPDNPTVSRDFEFAANYPNPFNASTDFAFELAREGKVELRIFNLAGQQVATLVDRIEQAGSHTVHFAAADLTSGIYFARLTANGATATRKIVLLK